MFFENDVITLDLNFYRVLYAQFERAAHLGGEDDASKVINFTDDASRFLIHVVISSKNGLG